MVEELKEIKGGTRLADEHGKRFKGWILTKTFLRKELISLEYKELDLSYSLNVFDYNLCFFMPPELEYNDGKIFYSHTERELGVFRFPLDEEGKYRTPLSMKKIQEKVKEKINELTPKEIEALIKDRKVLVFEAFHISQYGFEFFDVSPDQFKEIEELTDADFLKGFKEGFKQELHNKMETVKEKISLSPNYLLILLETLNQRHKDLAEISQMTNKIIHT